MATFASGERKYVWLDKEKEVTLYQGTTTADLSPGTISELYKAAAGMALRKRRSALRPVGAKFGIVHEEFKPLLTNPLNAQKYIAFERCGYVDPLTGLRCEEPGIVIRQDAHAEFENHAACTLHFPDLVHGSDGLEGYCMGCYRMRPSAEVQNFPAARICAKCRREELEEKRQQLAKEKQQADQEEQELHRQLELVAQKKGQILAKEREIQAEEKAIEEKQEADKKRRLDPDAAAYSTAVPAVPPVTTTPTVQDQTADLQRAGQHEAEGADLQQRGTPTSVDSVEFVGEVELQQEPGSPGQGRGS